MQYKVIKDANKIVKNCPYVVNDPYKNKKRWSEVFGNNHPICLELGMGRGDFIIDMAINYPNINFIGLEVVDSQMVNAVNKLDGKKLKEYPVEELRFKRKRRFDKVRIDDDKELKALEELERKEGKAHISDD